MATNKDAGPQLGQLITNGDRMRDAIHIAVAPVMASVNLRPGQPIALVQSDDGHGYSVADAPASLAQGIVDPFLTEPVTSGQRFWMFLYPGTITGLRHVWTHPVFAKAALEALEKVKARA